jgi:D-alanyl-D-alanine carboxypeptidase
VIKRGDYTFDRKGFYFAFLFVLLLVIVVNVAHYDTILAVSVFTNKSSVRVIPTQLPLAPKAAAAEVKLASAMPQRIINKLTIADTVPEEGKFIAADLVNMKLFLYQDGKEVEEYPIKTKGRPGTAWETPSGFYSIQTKEENHFSSIGKVYMPYSMQFYGNYFIHGWTYYPDGTPTAATFSGGCIKLETEDAKKVFAFADVGTKVFVYDATKAEPPPTLSLQPMPVPHINAPSFLVADIDTGDVYAEAGQGEPRPIASVTKLMTALVANEVISFDKKVSVSEGGLVNPPILEATTTKTFLVGDLLYPLLMQSSNLIADSLASYYSKKSFVRWMNTTAKAIGMTATTYADPSGISADNISTTDDLFRLAVYLSNKKSFVLKITNTPLKTIAAEDGSTYQIKNVNGPADTPPFEGGKVGHTTAASDTMLSVLSVKVNDVSRRIAVIVLGSDNQSEDTKKLAEWITAAAQKPTEQSACAACALPPVYRTVEI